jgi:hypothetical protein
MTDLHAPTVFDPETPHHARVYDYILGGKDNYAVDREAGERILEVAPDARQLGAAQRAFLVRVVRFLAESGIRQFVDLGTGIPTPPNVHQVAREIHPDARVAYVDFDAMVVAHARALMATDDRVIAIQEDIRNTDKLLANPELGALIDFDQPVAVLLLAILHDITDEHDPAGIVTRFRDRMVPGSSVAIEQFTSDSHPEAMARLQEVYADTPWPIVLRSREHITGFFNGFELLPPGLVDVQQWRPPKRRTPPTALKVAGGVGRRR